MKSIGELKKWLLENRKDKNGDLDLSGLDLSDFDGDVYINNMKVKKTLNQSYQEVGENLYQAFQKVDKDLFQDQQEVDKYFYNHKLNDDEYWEEKETYVIRRKKLKEITLEELEKMGYKLKEGM